MVKGKNTNRIGLAGEYAVLSQLAARGLDAALMPGNTQNFDIIAINNKSKKNYYIQVKTTTNTKPFKKKKYHGKNLFEWKVNPIEDVENLYYVFILFYEDGHKINRFFIVPNNTVYAYAVRQHKHWCKKTQRVYSAEYNPKTFRLGEDAHDTCPIETPLTKDHENKWDYFD